MSSFFEQFGHPEGPLGWFVGHLMAVKNGARSRWALDLLAPRAGEAVLEIGFGPGVNLGRLARAVAPHGRVAGVDVSAEMVRQARARNRREAVQLERASAMALPFDDASFDAVYSTNSAQFWPNLGTGVSEAARVLRPGGRAVIVVQPMWRGATDADTEHWISKLADAMRAASFAQVEEARRPLRPVLAGAAIGRTAGAVRVPG